MRQRIMSKPILAASLFGLACLAGASARAEEPAEAKPSGRSQVPEVVFSRDIQPLLAKHCLLCHGPDEAEGGLRLDSADRAYAQLESEARAIVPGDAEASELLRRVRSQDESVRMPPEGDPLTADQVALLRQWIEGGARYEQHWAFEPVKEPPLPAVKNETWVRNPIDRFVLARLEQEGIAPSPEADRTTLIKRLYYDLIGLPPAPNEVDEFLQDQSSDAYESLVDRLLESEHFGERWGRHWLDKARYADSDGYEKDRPRPNAWRYRDWVIEAVNRDMPFDRFTIEQLAGDLLPDSTPMQKLATAFHRQTLTNTEGGTDQEEFRVEATFDRTETTATVWMGLTMTCARCHSHKYDQITQQEYYELFSFFNDANEGSAEVAKSDEAMEQYRRDQAAHAAKVEALERKYEAAKEPLRPRIEAWEREMTERLTAASPVEYSPASLVEATADSGATLAEQDDHAVLVSGEVPDKDKYVLVIEAPGKPLTGLKLEVLSRESLPAKGPGRTPHGNFVLSELRVEAGADRQFQESSPVKFVSAEADFAQDKFAPQGALSSEERSGWAISPQMGKDHKIEFFTGQPLALDGKKFLRIELDQQYGGKHTIGCFRVLTMTGFDPLRALPQAVAEAVKTPAGQRTDAQRRRIEDHVAAQDPEAGKLAKELAALQNNAPQPPVMNVRILVPAERKTRLLYRGDFLQPADEVRSEALAVIRRIHPLRSRHPDQEPDRLDLARWLVDPQHPLTPRVTVNQVWAHLFGRGIVATLNDFGVRGEQPTHPQLLDWMAWKFPREMGWSRKTLIKTIVTSATYRQSSRHRPELAKIDPTNRLLARQNRVRVEAEIVRDLHLAVSGLLSKKVAGPSVFPPLPSGVAELSYANNFKWKTSQGEDRYRRGMYTFFKRTSPHPTLVSFDCPDSNTTRLARESSNTPLQALVTLNNDVFFESAQALARRVLSEGGQEDRQRLIHALRLCLVREPSDDEVTAFHELLTASRAYYEAHPEEAKKLTNRHAAEGVAAAENAAWVATLRMVMNLDEFIVRD